MTDNALATRPAHKSAWPMAAVFITFILMVGGPIAYVLISWNRAAINAPAKIVQTLSNFAADAARPKINVNELVLTSLGDLHKQSKLVVLKTSINADVTRDEASSRFGIYWGTNTARVLVKDARVQYYIDLAKTSTMNYRFDAASNVLTLTLPKPRLDTEMVGIDPGQISTLDLRGGWARFDKAATRENAILELRPTIITQANAPLVKKQAEEAGREAMGAWLRPLTDSLNKQGVRLRVEYL